MFVDCDAKDKVLDDQLVAQEKEAETNGFFGRLMAWNRPKILIVFGCFCSLVVGAS